MSHQPSTAETVKSTANSAYDTVAKTIVPESEDYDPNQDKANFKKDAHGNTVKKGDLKDKLNEAALGGSGEKEGYVEKGMCVLLIKDFVSCASGREGWKEGQKDKSRVG